MFKMYIKSRKVLFKVTFRAKEQKDMLLSHCLVFFDNNLVILAIGYQWP